MKECKILLVLLMLLTLCSCNNKFNPYRHMTTILSISTREQFLHDEDYILQHTAPELRDALKASIDGTIYDTSYSLVEKNVYLETTDVYTKLIAEYDYTSSLGDFNLVAYFEYEGDILVEYTIHTVEKDMCVW